ncbi:MAG: serine/threonine-protein kinase [Myxococcota bacterium]
MSDARDTAPEASDLEASTWLGRVIDGRYRVLEVLGVGGMGMVFVVEHVHLRHRLALKTLLPELTDHDEALARFQREALVLAALDHPSLGRAVDFGPLPGGGHFLVMPLVSGPTLTDHLARTGPLPWQEVAALGVQLADALAAVHGRGIVHRDVKPENVLVEARPEGGLRPVLLDFGIARIATGEGEVEPSRALTRAGAIMGTAGYMAPEQAWGQSVDARADLYALGVLLFEAVSGRPLFHPDLDLPEIVAAQLRHPVPPVNAPPRFRQLLEALLAPKPEGRPGSAQEVRASLQALAYAPPPPPTTTEPPAPSRQPAARGRLLVLAAAAFAVGIALGFVGRGVPETPETAEMPTTESPSDAGSADVAVLLEGSARARKEAAERLAATGDLPEWLRAVVALETAEGCTEHRSALRAIGEAGDARARPALRRITGARTRGCGALNLRDCHGCYREAAEEALRALEGEATP